MTQALISVIIPVYNAERYLQETIRSVQNQTYRNLEIILVDDGSTDGSLSLARSFTDDPRVRVIHTENRGASAARNTGIEAAQGEYCYFFDADDVLLPDALQTMMDGATSAQADLVITVISEGDENARPIRSRPLPLPDGVYSTADDQTLYDLMSRFPPSPETKLYKTSVIQKNNLRFDSVRVAQDLNFFLKYLSCADRVCVINQPVSVYRMVTGSISRQANRKILDIIASLDGVEAFLLDKGDSDRCLANLPEVRIIHYINQAHKYVYFASAREAKAVFIQFYDLIAELRQTPGITMAPRTQALLADMDRRRKFAFLFFHPLYLARCRRKSFRKFKQSMTTDA